ncbi:acyl-CoA dehydrogenase family protein [Halomonas mongoliensis]|uniref:acyl-CoA dehydrogenase family protein n=1 Tax=Halomonas mongoliensis TaxID=321265 RepID=UPI00403B2174
MSQLDPIIHDTTHRLFTDAVTSDLLARSAAGEWAGELWKQLEDIGLTTVLLPEISGGAGLPPAAALGLVRIAGWYGTPVPLPETLLASWLSVKAGLPLPAGPLTLGPVNRRESLQLSHHPEGWQIGGCLTRIPWGRYAKGVVVIAEHQHQAMLCHLTPADYRIERATNLAGEPRDTLHIDARLDASCVAAANPGFGLPQWLACGAALRTSAMAGALSRLLDMSVTHANDRVQFGRPIGRFQAVQQNLAVLACQAAAAGAAADIAAKALSTTPDLLGIAAAKARAGEAAGTGTAIAHQVHGAIGFTEEHNLHFHTKRLLAWRDEFGHEPEWNRQVGELAVHQGAEGLWPMIAGL